MSRRAYGKLAVVPQRLQEGSCRRAKGDWVSAGYINIIITVTAMTDGFDNHFPLHMCIQTLLLVSCKPWKARSIMAATLLELLLKSEFVQCVLVIFSSPCLLHARSEHLAESYPQ